jgi:hypothetical protein
MAAHLHAPAAQRRSGRWQAEVLLVAVLYLAYDGSRLLVGGGVDDAVRDATRLLSLEQWLHLDPERWLNSIFSSQQWLGIPADYAYASLHYLVTPAVLVWLWRSHRERYRKARTWLGITTVMALAGFVLFPAAPPRLLPGSLGFTDTMAQHAGIGWWDGAASAPKGLGSMTNEFAAMPSLHVGWALWCGLTVFLCARDRTVRVLGLLYPVLITLVVIGTGNHYLLDCVAGALLLAVGAVLTGPALRTSDRVRAWARAALMRRRGAAARPVRPVHAVHAVHGVHAVKPAHAVPDYPVPDRPVAAASDTPLEGRTPVLH